MCCRVKDTLRFDSGGTSSQPSSGSSRRSPEQSTLQPITQPRKEGIHQFMIQPIRHMRRFMVPVVSRPKRPPIERTILEPNEQTTNTQPVAHPSLRFLSCSKFTKSSQLGFKVMISAMLPGDYCGIVNVADRTVVSGHSNHSNEQVRTSYPISLSLDRSSANHTSLVSLNTT